MSGSTEIANAIYYLASVLMKVGLALYFILLLHMIATGDRK